MRQKSRSRLLLGFGIAVAIGGWLFREPLRDRIVRSVTLANLAPPPELVEEMIEKSPDRAAAILAAWNTGKIVHRQVAVREIFRAVPPDKPMPSELESVVLAGALDVDMNVRETALGILQIRNDPALASLAAAQLQDRDPQVRLLGLNYLKHVSAGAGVRAVLPRLDEDDPLIVATGLKLLEHWSGENFGVKLRETAPIENEKTGLKEFPEGSNEKAGAGAARARAWWARHQAEFPPVDLEIPREAIAARKPVPAGDFSLRALDGRQVRLANLRGKVVVINFWTTWCTACVSEMPELIALQKQHGDRLVIVGVSLDFVPDEHGHIGGHAAVEEQGLREEEHPDHERNREALEKVREKVARTMKARGINYTVLLDEANEIGGRFNGGELPTTVILDAQGNVRRRFIGARSLPVFEAMIAEASEPDRFAPK
jgi:thiol-disulfide isomerase/thioredoxin